MNSHAQLEEQALTQFEAGHLNDAESLFRKLLHRDSNNITAHFHLALIEYKKGDYPLALMHAKTVVQLNPKEPNAYLNIGCIYEKMGDSSKAVENYRLELQQNLGAWEAWSNLGSLQFENGNCDEAAKCLQKSFKATHSSQDRTLLAEAYFRTGQLDAEIELYRYCLDRNKDDLWALDNLGAALIDSNKPKLALYFLKRAKKLAPGDPRIDHNIAKVFQAMGKRSFARANNVV